MRERKRDLEKGCGIRNLRERWCWLTIVRLEGFFGRVVVERGENEKG